MCQLDTENREWMCNDCTHSTQCSDVYNIVDSTHCTPDDSQRFNKMYDILLARIPLNEQERYAFYGNASCSLGSIIALSLNSIYGNVCAPNERAQLNAAQTHIFCMCKSTYCDVEYTDVILNILLSCVIAMLALYLIMKITMLYISISSPSPSALPCSPNVIPAATTDCHAASTRHWSRMRIEHS